MSDFYIVETGEYEDRHVVGVYRTEQGGIDDIKRLYGPPSRVTWTETRDEEGNLCLVGQFDWVPHYSAEHTARFHFEDGTFGDARGDRRGGACRFCVGDES